VKVQVPKKALLARFVLNRWGKAFILTVAVSITLALAVFTFYYVKYSRLIESKLRAGAFASTSMLFAAPHLISVGDESTPAEVVSLLRRSGYSESRNAAMGSYNLRPDAVEIYPGPESYFRREAVSLSSPRTKSARSSRCGITTRFRNTCWNRN